MVRFLSGCLMFLALAAASPHDSFDFRAHYGEPNLERFNIRPGITMTAEYGPDGKACVLDIQPRQDFFREMVADETLSKDTVTSVLDEVVPPSTRGKETIPAFSLVVAGGCNAGMTWADYDNVQINLSYGFCVMPIGVHRATVHFKRSACGQPPIDSACLKKGGVCVF
jgi:hypothetical protein